MAKHLLRSFRLAIAGAVKFAGIVIVASAGITIWPGAAVAADPRPCELFSSGQVATVTGTAPGRAQPAGPDVEKELAATSWTCAWPASERHLAVKVMRFRSAPDATRAMTTINKQTMGFPDGVRLLPASGAPGEQALWGASAEEELAVWVARKGPTLFVVVLGGELKAPESFKEPLRKLLAAGIEKL
ncbi:MAG TPA: hypothetical protein PKA20_25645 [Burkholderiaceae bacterium]|nr:hypothetical protein [Burkholderiaceae bacterium]